MISLGIGNNTEEWVPTEVYEGEGAKERAKIVESEMSENAVSKRAESLMSNSLFMAMRRWIK